MLFIDPNSPTIAAISGFLPAAEAGAFALTVAVLAIRNKARQRLSPAEQDRDSFGLMAVSALVMLAQMACFIIVASPEKIACPWPLEKLSTDGARAIGGIGATVNGLIWLFVFASAAPSLEKGYGNAKMTYRAPRHPDDY